MCLSPNETEYIKDDHSLPSLQPEKNRERLRNGLLLMSGAGLKFKVHTCGNMLNAFMHIIPKGNITCNKQRRPRLDLVFQEGLYCLTQ